MRRYLLITPSQWTDALQDFVDYRFEDPFMEFSWTERDATADETEGTNFYLRFLLIHEMLQCQKPLQEFEDESDVDEDGNPLPPKEEDEEEDEFEEELRQEQKQRRRERRRKAEQGLAEQMVKEVMGQIGDQSNIAMKGGKSGGGKNKKEQTSSSSTVQVLTLKDAYAKIRKERQARKKAAKLERKAERLAEQKRLKEAGKAAKAAAKTAATAKKAAGPGKAGGAGGGKAAAGVVADDEKPAKRKKTK
eukprot:g19547.t1